MRTFIRKSLLALGLSLPFAGLTIGDGALAANLKLAHGAATSNPRHEAAQKFAELVAEKTNGEVSVTVFPAGQLGNERQYLEALSSGGIDFALAGTPIFAAYAPELELLDMPYVFDSYQTAWSILDGPLGEKLAAGLERNGFQILAYWENGMRHITNNVRPIATPEDLKGLKIRTSSSKVRMATFEALGAAPVPIAFGELYLALSQGVVDGQENPVSNIYSAKFWEVQKYLSLTGHVYGALPLAVSIRSWDKLDAETRQAVLAAALEARDFHRQLVQDEEAGLLESLAANGMTANDVADKEPFREKARQVWSIYREKFGDAPVDDVLDAAGIN